MQTLADQLQRNIAGNVRRLRRREGWPQEELAHKAGLSTTYVARVERAEANISIGALAAICTALRIRPAALLRTAAVLVMKPGRPRSRRPRPT